MSNTYKFDVKMTCSGCSGAVTKALQRAEGVESFDVNLDSQEVLVKGPATYDYILEKIKKTGKEVRKGEIVETVVV